MSPEALGAITALISVVVSAGIAAVSLRSTLRMQREDRDRQFGLSLLPRRVAAFETAWRVAFEAEATGAIGTASQDELVAASLWLPESTRRAVLQMVRAPGEADFGAIRRELDDTSGSVAIESLVTRWTRPQKP